MKVANTNTPTMLAKLLAKENINVVVGNYNTAFFDVKNRTLGLPTWNTESKFVSDLLVGHEVGHALHTPEDAISRFHEKIPGAPFSIGNVVEDIRIERMVRDNYPGLVYSFREGYKHFIEKDFFKIKNKDLRKMGFIDRLNLKGKIGNLVDVPLTSEEEVLYNRCLTAESYDEVLEICKDIYDFVGAEKLKQQQNSSPSDESEETQDQEEQSSFGEQGDADADADADADKKDSDSEESGSGESSDSGSDESSDESSDSAESAGSDEPSESSDESADAGSSESSDDSSETEDNNTTTPETNAGADSFKPNYSDDADPFESLTQNEFDSNLKNLQKNIDCNVINGPKKQQTMNTVVSIEKIMNARRTHPLYHSAMNNADFVAHFAQFKTSTKKHIAILIKEFERRKSAFQYSRSRESASGSINVNRLHSYKFEDQIFKSVTTLADAKSHGMVFFIDYSGSMRYTLEDVIDQTLQLVYFCKAVGIPFEVYGFTCPDDLTAYRGSEYNTSSETSTPFGLNLRLEDTTHIFELLNSSLKKDAFELSVRELKAQVFKFNSISGCKFNMHTRYEHMSGTPLLETIIVAHDIVKNFKAKHKIQKMNTVFLTDGDGGRMMFNDNNSDSQFRNPIKGSIFGCSKYSIKVHGNEINFDYSGNYNACNKQLYSDLIKNLKDTCGTTVLGFFVAQNERDLRTNGIDSFIYNSNNKEGRATWTTWTEAAAAFKTAVRKNKKEKCLLVKGAFNYDAYFIFENKRNLNIAEDNSFESDSLSSGKSFNESSVQNKLAKDFAKFTSEKRTSRVFLNKFAEIIA